jgi:hypothetical protein
MKLCPLPWRIAFAHDTSIFVIGAQRPSHNLRFETVFEQNPDALLGTVPFGMHDARLARLTGRLLFRNDKL